MNLCTFSYGLLLFQWSKQESKFGQAQLTIGFLLILVTVEDSCQEGSVLPSTCTDYCNDPAFSCTNPDAVSCQINYCGGKCTGEYFNANGERVSCFGGKGRSTSLFSMFLIRGYTACN